MASAALMVMRGCAVVVSMLLFLATLAAATERVDTGSLADLIMPAPQTCIEGLFADDPDFAVYDGLSVEQLGQSMDDFIPTLFRCIPEDTSLHGLVELQITVGCDGRVSGVAVQETENVDPSLISCVSEMMHFASFPAHDTPSGVQFLYPMQFEF